MNIFPFNEMTKQQIRKVIDYASQNIYDTDDLLDMMNEQMSVPGMIPEHLIRVPFGLWICYYIVNHPQHGRCHYFTFKSDARGKLPDKASMEYVLKEFGIEKLLVDKDIRIDEENEETTLILPFNK